MLFTAPRKLIAALFILTLLHSAKIMAEPAIELLNSKYSSHAAVLMPKIFQLIKQHFATTQYRQIKAQLIYNEKHQVDHILVYLFSKKYHQVEFASINVDVNLRIASIQKKHQLSTADYIQQPGISAAEAQCPDPTVEFIVFAPNDIRFEQNAANQVADSAEAHSLKTIRLLLDEATRENYLNYMKCPKLQGNFYDGDANPEVITTVDGVISYKDIESTLRNQFRYKVTNIWLACQAYIDPIKTSVLTIAQSQKYAAGINNLLVGPSDRTGVCTMKSAMDGQPMTAAFNECYLKYDTNLDQWGFGGDGADIFGT